jgi:hypothetical protein
MTTTKIINETLGHWPRQEQWQRERLRIEHPDGVPVETKKKRVLRAWDRPVQEVVGRND